MFLQDNVVITQENMRSRMNKILKMKSKIPLHELVR